MFRSRSWFGSGWGRPKNPHSLEHLKYLYNVLSKNQTVSEHNRGLLVESLRCIAEILIWGDQNDSSVFDFFLEKNMLSFFLRIMRQRSGGSSFVCVQLLQTLNILFENIRNETSLYYLLSNNHVNSIIVHKFDFSDEEVMAYYISFLKTLSLKLNGHTIHFFYNEHTRDFPLYTEAIKFFNHPETMVRIAVRTLTLNVYRVQDASMLKFIRDRTAAPYFSNLVWFIGKHILELDSCVRNNADHQSQQKLDDLVAEHLDHLHYINDILCLNIPDLNDVLTEHLLHKLLIPLYIYSLTSSSTYSQSSVNVPTRDQVQSIESITRNLAAILKHVEMAPEKRASYPHASSDSSEEEFKPSVSCVVALFLLSQVFLIITHGPIVHALAWIILQSDNCVFEEGATKILEMYLDNKKSSVKLEFSKPSLTLEKALESSCLPVTPGNIAAAVEYDRFCDDSYDRDADQYSCDLDPDVVCNSLPSTSHVSEASSTRHNSTDDLSTLAVRPYDTVEESSQINIPDSPLPDCEKPSSASNLNSNFTDEEKQKIFGSAGSNEQLLTLDARLQSEALEVDDKPFLKTVLDSMDCLDNDYKALFSLCLLFALINNKGVNTELLDILLCPVVTHPTEQTDPSAAGSDAAQTRPTGPPSGAHSSFNILLVDKLLTILHLSCKPTSKVRLVTLELSVRLLRIALEGNGAQRPHPRHIQQVELVRNKATALLKNFYKCDDLFLDMFEDEYCEMCKRPLNVEWLCMDAAILLPPTRTPMSGIAFAKRLPSGEVERARRAIRSYFLIRDLYLKLTGKPETLLPLANPNPFVQVGDILDLNDSDLISCNITKKDGTWHHQFLAIDHIQIILVEPDKHRLGWGVAKLVGSLQDLEIQGDKEDPRCLHVTIHKPLSTSSSGGLPRAPLLSAKFKFDDHIRSMATKQRLTKGRTKSRQKKMQQIARLLEIPGMTGAVPNSYKSNPSGGGRQHRPLFTAGARHPGFAALRRESAGSAEAHQGPERRIRNPSVHLLKDGMMVVYGGRTSSRDGYNLETRESWNNNWLEKIKDTLEDTYVGSHLNRSSSRNSSTTRSRESSPRPRSEEIPLEDIKSLEARGALAAAHGSYQTPIPAFSGVQAATATGATSRLVQARPQRASSISQDVCAPRSQSLDSQKAASENGKLTTQRSEETSFIADDGTKAKKKGRIEII